MLAEVTVVGPRGLRRAWTLGPTAPVVALLFCRKARFTAAGFTDRAHRSAVCLLPASSSEAAGPPAEEPERVKGRVKCVSAAVAIAQGHCFT
ncbi:hypothetical protein NDU88_000685 [Pleurodeles waltl]|uniref:Secreted protein n=1 Tax=Pleurodeles waltl TaxID=8319 RepID=A0AAV7USH0_PLEWA|nr:hypothetical protein NDU88_000685 [Pleurodeles waltl]